MEISNGAAKKICRARKTMNQSCRQQVETLNKKKDVWRKEKTSKETYEDQSLQLKKSVDIVCKNYFAQENSVSELSKMPLFSEDNEVCSSKLNVSIEVLDIDSGENISCLNKNIICFADHQSEAQDVLKEKSIWKKENSASSKSVRDPLLQNELANKSVNEAHSTAKPTPLLPALQKECVQFVAASKCEDDITDRMIPILEKVTPRLNPDIENEDLTIPVLEKFNMVEDSKAAQPTEDAVTGAHDIKNLDTSVCSVTRILYREDNTAGDVNSKTSNRCFENISKVANAVSPQDLISTGSRIGVTQRKRIHSGKDENAKRKHQKTGDEKQVHSHGESKATKVCLEKLRCLIEEQIHIFFRSGFDQRLEELTERVKQIECKKNHEELAAKCLRKLHRIENRVNLLATHKEDLQPQRLLSKCDSSKVAVTVSNSERNFHLSNQFNSQPSKTSLSSNITAKQTSTVKPHIRDNSKDPIILCDSDSNSCKSDSEDVNLNATGAILSEVQKNSNISGEQVSNVLSTNGEAEIQSENMVPKADVLKQTQLVVDLTVDEDQQKSEKDVLAKIRKGSMGNDTLPILATDRESAASSNTSSASSNSKSKQAETSLECVDHSVTLQKTSCSDPELPVEMNVLPPQKYELQLTEVINPKGIALSWNVAKINPRCAAVKNYFLYMYQETCKTSIPKWIKIGEIKAMPLPMACTLTQFASGNKYHFTLRAKDIYGHYGPFCDIQSITLHLSDSP